VNRQAAAQLVAQETGSLGQAFDGIRNRFQVVVEHREKHLGMGVIRRDLHFRNRNHADPRVLQLEYDDFGQVLLDLVCNPQTAARDGFTMFSHTFIRRGYALYLSQMNYRQLTSTP